MYNAATKKCILNDYDLASVMDPSTEVPERQGYERTGTRPFMALDLLKPEGVAGHIRRRHRHDLESFCWVLVWFWACVHNGKEILTGCYAKMAVGTHNEVYKEKLALLDELTESPKTQDGLQNVIVDWMVWWYDMKEANKGQRRCGIPVKEEPAKYFVDGLVNTATDIQPVPMEIDWPKIKVRASSWRKYQKRHSLLGNSQ
ncbi:hypothetical protein MPER_11768 [Moniliophthora perniciosa FA553]|nr:hypothetical protein MPER_11768 [Moniliophthora perniciosa FA553]